jgi:hypothetical protein
MVGGDGVRPGNCWKILSVAADGTRREEYLVALYRLADRQRCGGVFR